MASAGDLLAELRALYTSALEDRARALGIYTEAEAEAWGREGNRVLELKALDTKGRAEERAARLLVLLARLRGELDARRRELPAGGPVGVVVTYAAGAEWRDRPEPGPEVPAIYIPDNGRGDGPAPPSGNGRTPGP